MSANERTGWRDTSRISERHRMYGINVPCCDLDFPLIEYNRGVTVALIEYKHECVESISRNNPSIRALTDLGNRANVPVFIARYKNDFSQYQLIALNDMAKEKLLNKEKATLTEAQYVIFLHSLRGYNAPETLIKNFNKYV